MPSISSTDIFATVFTHGFKHRSLGRQCCKHYRRHKLITLASGRKSIFLPWKCLLHFWSFFREKIRMGWKDLHSGQNNFPLLLFAPSVFPVLGFVCFFVFKSRSRSLLFSWDFSFYRHVTFYPLSSLSICLYSFTLLLSLSFLNCISILFQHYFYTVCVSSSLSISPFLLAFCSCPFLHHYRILRLFFLFLTFKLSLYHSSIHTTSTLPISLFFLCTVLIYSLYFLNLANFPSFWLYLSHLLPSTYLISVDMFVRIILFPSCWLKFFRIVCFRTKTLWFSLPFSIFCSLLHSLSPTSLPSLCP
jgi:hypothetical protein